MLIPTFLISISFLVFCSANNVTDIKPQQRNIYCEIQEERCKNLPHPLCPTTFNTNNLESENFQFTELSYDDIDLVVTTINQFRNELASGKVYRHRNRASNLRIVKWSPDFVRLLYYHLQFIKVCTHISIDGQYVLHKEIFEETFENKTFYRHEFPNRIWGGANKNSPPWIDLYREEFDRIGCIYYEDHDYLIYYFVCYTNQYGLKEGESEVNIEKMYKYGEPCTECDEGGCNKKWPNLCDPDVPKPLRFSGLTSGYANYYINIYFFTFCILSATIFINRL